MGAFVPERQDQKAAIHGRTLQENLRCGHIAASDKRTHAPACVAGGASGR
jgi:hypothetical protein